VVVCGWWLTALALVAATASLMTTRVRLSFVVRWK
jgi:hypothetical protein